MIFASEGLVELGMTPAQALTAATRNDAFAARGLADYGAVERGKLADQRVLAAQGVARRGMRQRSGKACGSQRPPTIVGAVPSASTGAER